MQELYILSLHPKKRTWQVTYYVACVTWLRGMFVLSLPRDITLLVMATALKQQQQQQTVSGCIVYVFIAEGWKACVFIYG